MGRKAHRSQSTYSVPTSGLREAGCHHEQRSKPKTTTAQDIQTYVTQLVRVQLIPNPTPLSWPQTALLGQGPREPPYRKHTPATSQGAPLSISGIATNSEVTDLGFKSTTTTTRGEGMARLPPASSSGLLPLNYIH